MKDITILLTLFLIFSCTSASENIKSIEELRKDLESEIENLRLILEQSDIALLDKENIDALIDKNESVSKSITKIAKTIDLSQDLYGKDLAVQTAQSVLFPEWESKEFRNQKSGETCYNTWEGNSYLITIGWSACVATATATTLGSTIAVCTVAAAAAEVINNQAFGDCINEY